jgi:hypothetical protein
MSGLDVRNGLLLSALWDAPFDKGLVSFDDGGRPLVSPGLSGDARQALGLDAAPAAAGGCATRIKRTWRRIGHGMGFESGRITSAIQ